MSSWNVILYLPGSQRSQAQRCLAGRQQLDTAYSFLSQLEAMNCSIIPVTDTPMVETSDVHEAEMAGRIQHELPCVMI